MTSNISENMKNHRTQKLKQNNAIYIS
uniref:Uncharacterized protein n=1 Tax=Rhizophora mucronata TaxID=61149 RepID=A0A2P2NIV3_RHIMU